MMVVFGGIYEVTKELDDLIVFDIKNKRWIVFFEEMVSPGKAKGNTSSPGFSTSSPGTKGRLSLIKN
jgi:hypothetical protein